MDFLRDPLSCKPAPVRSVSGSLDSEAGSHTLRVWALHRTSAHLALRGHALGLVAPAQNHPAPEQEWQSVP